jgi:ribonuclease PH
MTKTEELEVHIEEHEDGSATLTIEGLDDETLEELQAIGIKALIAAYAVGKTPDEMFVDVMKGEQGAEENV